MTSSLAMLIATAAWGQHAAGGGAHMGGGGGHVGSGFSSGRSFAAPSAPRVFGNSSPSRTASQGRANYQWSPAPFGGTYPYGGRNPNGGRGYNYRPYYSRGVYAYPAWLAYGLNGGYYGGYYGDDYSDEQEGGAVGDAGTQQVAADTYDPYGGEQPQYPPPPRAAYQPAASAPAPDQPEVTLLFKDGRAPQRVQNYAITQTTLYVLDGERRHEIPLEQIDLPGTVKANRAAGVDFDVPVATD